MNKTISINIGGRVFNIEEAAYDRLNTYLLTIRGYFAGNESTDEIIADIELRIAELFLERTSPQKQAITSTDVDEVIAIMGQPEDYMDADAAGEETFGSSHYSRGQHRSRRVFRDPDNKVLFGTCSGISAYFGWDPIILRLVFALLFIFFGTGLLIYIILTIIIPKAKTTAEKLEMHGEPVTVENISRKVSESFEDVKQDIRDFGKKNVRQKDLDNFGTRIGDFVNSLIQLIGRILTIIIEIIGKLLGLALFAGGIMAILIFVSMALGWDTIFNFDHNGIYLDEQFRNLMEATFASPTLQTMAFIGIIGVVLIPVIAILMIGVRLLFNYRGIPGYVGLVLATLWFVAVGLLAATGGKLYKEFHMETEFVEKVEMALPSSSLLYIDIARTTEPVYKFKSGFRHGEIFYSGAVTFPGIDSTEILYIGKNKFTVAMSPTDSTYSLSVMRRSHGNSQKDAIENARGIKYHTETTGDSLLIFPYHAIQKGYKMRGQEMHFILNVPVGKSVHFAERARDILYDVPNVTNTHDRNMVGKTWTMTTQGLKCADCIQESDTLENGAFTYSESPIERIH